jgi:hypothetical protein
MNGAQVKTGESTHIMTMRKQKMTTKSNLVPIMRTCNADMTSHGGFKWPRKGLVTCSDWKPTYRCGNGLHGLLNGEGDGELLNWADDAVWLVVMVDASVILSGQGDLIDKCKFPRGTVVFSGARDKAIAEMVMHGADPAKIVGGKATAGVDGTATAGDRGKATAGYYGTATAGVRGKATAGDYGTATAGVYGKATAGDRGKATAGDYGTATAGVGGTATAGYYGKATAGYYGTATAGVGGILHIRYWGGNRYRLAIFYVGEDGIEPNTPYRLNDDHKVVKA